MYNYRLNEVFIYTEVHECSDEKGLNWLLGSYEQTVKWLSTQYMYSGGECMCVCVRACVSVCERTDRETVLHYWLLTGRNQ